MLVMMWRSIGVAYGEATLRTSRSSGRWVRGPNLHMKPLPAADLERSKYVLSLMGAGIAALRERSQEATLGTWLKPAKQSGSSVGLRVSVI